MGASGAIFAVTLAYAVLYPDSVILIWGIIPVPAPILVIGYAAFEVFNLIFASSSGVAHATHLIGYAVAWAYCLVRFGINPWKVWNAASSRAGAPRRARHRHRGRGDPPARAETYSGASSAEDTIVRAPVWIYFERSPRDGDAPPPAEDLRRSRDTSSAA
jgi:hypothetical protein